MNEFGATVFMITLFALRCVAPLLITLGVGYLMNRLLDRWAAEDAQVREPVPGGAVPAFGAERTPAAEPRPSILSIPCWVFNNCEETRRASCPGCNEKGIPCWQARLMAEGRLPETCPDCPRYIAAHAVA
ncbi:MAG TPA: hypothetical protein VK879_06425 [Candidatus Sulfomarinibacteraceae bacterium]|nr:hypothetical protein [Candidatus Sulfomarinibacteraceae bacterium]